MEQIEALTVLDSEIDVGYLGENLDDDFVICSDSIMEGSVSMRIWEVDITVEFTEGLHHFCESLTDSNIQSCALCIV